MLFKSHLLILDGWSRSLHIRVAGFSWLRVAYVIEDNQNDARSELTRVREGMDRGFIKGHFKSVKVAVLLLAQNFGSPRVQLIQRHTVPIQLL